MQPQHSNTVQLPHASGLTDRQQMESLISMIVILYIEDQHLLTDEQVNEARSSLRALFLQTAGQETLLRKLIQILKTNKALNQSFDDISSILTGISKSSATIKRKIETFKIELSSLDISVEEHADFIGPFLQFSGEFAGNVGQFERLIYSYRDAREREARFAHMFRIAKEARQRLKERFSGAGNSESEEEDEIREKVIHTFDYGETETNLQYAQKEAKNTELEIETLLDVFKEMCRFAKNPAMREKEIGYQPFQESRYPDVFSLFTQAQAKYPRIEMIREPILELFRLYQHSYGMFGLDFHKFNEAIQPMIENADAYFQAKDEDEDIRSKRLKLEKIEGLIAFLEHTTLLLRHIDGDTFVKFSRDLTDIIAKPASRWVHISENLLQMKVAAEADLSTRIS